MNADQFYDWERRFLAHSSDPEVEKQALAILRRILSDAKLTFHHRQGKKLNTVGIDSVIDISDLIDPRVAETSP